MPNQKHIPEALPEIEDNEIRIELSGGVVHGMECGKNVDLTKLGIHLTLVDADIEGVTPDEMEAEPDSYFMDNGYPVQYRGI